MSPDQTPEEEPPSSTPLEPKPTGVEGEYPPSDDPTELVKQRIAEQIFRQARTTDDRFDQLNASGLGLLKNGTYVPPADPEAEKKAAKAKETIEPKPAAGGS